MKAEVHSSKGGRDLLCNKSGVVYVEYLIVVMPLFTMFLCMVQLALMMEAGIIAHHAANRAARAAIVAIREPENFISNDNGGPVPATDNYVDAASAIDPVKEMVLGLGRGSNLVGVGEVSAGYNSVTRSGSARVFMVKSAAQMKLLSISPVENDLHGGNVGGSSVKYALGNTQSLNDAAGGGKYAYHATGVQVSNLDNWNGNPTTINVGVAFIFPCMVPIAQTMFCGADTSYSGYDFTGGDPAGIASTAVFTRVIRHNIQGVPVARQIYMPGERH